jgi:enoyl-CoA hydratase/carnithine racemase
MALTPKSFRLEFDSATQVATLTLFRPDRLNALTFEVYNELRETFVALNHEPDVRAVILTGTGRAFSSGGDVEDIIGRLLERDHQGLLDFTRVTGALISSIRRCSKPVVGALNGLVAGAGAVMATACDIRIAAENAKIAFLFTKVGLAGADMGAAWLLPRIVGISRATEILMTGEFVDAKEAERIGLYNRVVPTDQLADEARKWAEKLARGPSFALAQTKEMLNREASLDLDSALEWEAQAQAACMLHPNFRESYDAFMAKRPPKFS